MTAARDGGMELGMAESVLVFSELGRVAAPGPLVWTNLAAALVDGAGAGETVVGCCCLASCALRPTTQLDPSGP